MLCLSFVKRPLNSKGVHFKTDSDIFSIVIVVDFVFSLNQDKFKYFIFIIINKSLNILLCLFFSIKLHHTVTPNTFITSLQFKTYICDKVFYPFFFSVISNFFLPFESHTVVVNYPNLLDCKVFFQFLPSHFPTL